MTSPLSVSFKENGGNDKYSNATMDCPSASRWQLFTEISFAAIHISVVN
jgi:hypothetical protein